MERVSRSKEAARKSYNAMSRWYDLFTGSEKRLTNIGIELLDVQPNESILEIGCGAGHALVEFANKGAKIIALDISEEMIKAARRRIQDKVQKRSVTFCQGDGLSVPFPDGQFDAIFLSFTLELFDTPEIPLVLGECHRILKSGGRIGVVALSKQDTAAVRIYEWFHRRMPTLVDCRPIFIESVLRGAKFVVAKESSQTMWGLPVGILAAQK